MYLLFSCTNVLGTTLEGYAQRVCTWLPRRFTYTLLRTGDIMYIAISLRFPVVLWLCLSKRFIFVGMLAKL